MASQVKSVQHTAKTSQGGDVKVAWGTYEIATALAINSTVTFFTMPAGATVIAGWLVCDDLDTGIEALEIDVGDASSATRFLNSGVLDGDAVTGVKPETGISMRLFGTLKDGPYTYTSATDIIGTWTAAAVGGGTGTVSLIMLYTYNDPRVSPPSGPVA